MTAIADAGAGLLLRAGNLDRDGLIQALRRLHQEASFTDAAVGLAREFSRWDAGASFAAFVDGVAR
ncbi:MAG: hypothetical protein H7X95_00945 [Deltaproteobacteria bacterium]|nr:hypothetical protein [Deltaproteobacteria bacterium]